MIFTQLVGVPRQNEVANGPLAQSWIDELYATGFWDDLNDAVELPARRRLQQVSHGILLHPWLATYSSETEKAVRDEFG